MYPYKYKSSYGNKYQSRYDEKYQSRSDRSFSLRSYERHRRPRPANPCITLGIKSCGKRLLSLTQRSIRCLQRLFRPAKNVNQSAVSSEQSCSICLSALEEKDKNTKWICKHRFHKECIESWNGTCPLCRCDINLLTSTFYDYKEDMRWQIEIYLKLSKIVTRDEDVIMLKSHWKHSKCTSDNHEITFHCTNHIAGICHNCSILDNNFGSVGDAIIQN